MSAVCRISHHNSRSVMPQEVTSKPEKALKEDVEKIKEWLRKQPHLPDTMDDRILAKFLHASYYGLEKTKQCIESFFTIRSEIPELFRNRDPMSSALQTQLNITNYVCTKNSDSARYIFWQLNDPTLSQYVFYDCMKTFFMQADAWMLEDATLEQRDVAVVDMKAIPLKIVTYMNLSTLGKSAKYLLEAFPTRLKEIHALNCPPFMDKLFNLIRPFLPPEIFQIIHFHQPDSDSIHKFIEKENIPIEFGGSGPKAETLMKTWIDVMKKRRDFYLDDSRWIADESKRPKKQFSEEMKGSFRSLCVD